MAWVIQLIASKGKPPSLTPFAAYADRTTAFIGSIVSWVSLVGKCARLGQL